MWNISQRRLWRRVTQKAANGLLAGLIAAAAFLPVPSVKASGGMPSAFFDADEVGWSSVRNYSVGDFQDYFDARADAGYMLIDLEVAVIDGEARYSGVFQQNLDGRDWGAKAKLTHDEFSQNWTNYKNADFRLIDQESYVLDGTRYFAGIWIKNLEGLSWASYRNVTSAQFSEKFDIYDEAGYMPIDVEGYPYGSGVRYSAVWVKNVEGLDWKLWRDMTADEYAQKFDQYKEDYRVHHVMSYQRNGEQNYAAIWIENENGRHWYAYRDMSAQGYANRWEQMRDLGFRLTGFETYETTEGRRYAGVWRQNSMRPQWGLKDEVDALVEDHLEEFDIPGVSVAVAQHGQFVYMRGFGHADVDDDVWANSRTIFRLASVSKAVAGVLTMRLVEKDDVELALDNNTRTYVPEMPNHHTHTIRQLASNRSGVGHYEDHGSWNAQYDTATEAAELFWDDPLVYTPGTSCKYSTHGYTLLGAALESVTGKEIGEIIEDELTVPFGLPTLRVEDRSVADADRTTLYNTDNSEATPDNTSWKVLGGGLEASAYDLARFGIKLMDGDIIDETSLTTMWTAPDNCDNYGLGWDLGTEEGTQLVGKGGDQLGTRTYLRLYPEKEIVIVVLTNRDEGGHSPSSVAQEIGLLMLAEEDAAPDPIGPILPEVDVEEVAELQEPPMIIIDPPAPLPEEEDAPPAPENDLPLPTSSTTQVFLPLVAR